MQDILLFVVISEMKPVEAAGAGMCTMLIWGRGREKIFAFLNFIVIFVVADIQCAIGNYHQLKVF